MKPSYSAILDAAISNTPDGIRILYLESDYPNILDTVLNPQKGSSKLRNWLNLDKDTTFERAQKNGICKKLAMVFKSTAPGLGVLANTSKVDYLDDKTTYYYKREGKPCFIRFRFKEQKVDPPNLPVLDLSKNTQQKSILIKADGPIVVELQPRFEEPASADVRFFYLTDADTLDSKLLAEMIQAFLDSRDIPAYKNAKLILTGTCRHIPDGFASRVQLIRLGSPTVEDIAHRLIEVTQNESDKVTVEIAKQKAESMRGLTFWQIENILSAWGASYVDRMLKAEKELDDAIWKQKRLENEKDRTLKYSRIDKNPGIVGMGGFCKWLNERLPDLVNPEEAKNYGLTPPRGVILSGVPGTGKSQLSKQMAFLWSNYGGTDRNVNWIEFDIGSLSSHEYGKSEEKMERFLARISEQEPAVLFVDEVEKVFFKDHDGKAMHEVKRQQMGRFLGWLQEHQENIFTFMTSNDISILPPELIRSGRISERFFVFMPSYVELMSILYSKLRDRANLFEEGFQKSIIKKCKIIDAYSAGTKSERDLKGEMASDPLGEVLNKLAELGKSKHRTPFMTGADVGDLVDNTMRCLRQSGKNLKKCKAEDFAEAMKKICIAPAFKPYGQSNLSDLAKLYLSCDYRDVSADPLLPRESFDAETGKFKVEKTSSIIQNTNPDNDYDRYMQTALREAIEKAADEEAGERAFRRKQREFQEEQMADYRKNKAEKGNSGEK